MANEKIFQKIKKAYEKEGTLDILEDLFSYCVTNEDHVENKYVRKEAQEHIKDGEGYLAYDLWRRSLLFDAPVEFDAYCLYIELDRENKFYAPRRKQLKKIVDALQRLEDNETDILCISMPPRVGKTTTALFYLTWLAGRHPEKGILSSSHNASFLSDCYNECLRILDKDGEYLWHDVFPYSQVAGTNAQAMKIDINKRSRFSTLQFSSIGSGNAGKVNAQQLLYCDDLVEGIEEAMSKDRLDKKIKLYTTDLEQRKEAGNWRGGVGAGCKELHIATRWSVNDCIGHIKSREEGNPRAEFLVLPALDENDESNFDYLDGVGFSTEFYHKMRSDMISANEELSWKALYMNEPIEREGLLYTKEELRTYNELPSYEPDGIVGICDTKTTGLDYCFMPVAYVYGDEWYIEDCILDNGEERMIENRLVAKIKEHNMQMVDFESNSAGSVIARNVSDMLKQQRIRCTVKTHHTQANKETKIIVNAGWVKEHCIFKMEYNKDYGKMLDFLCSYVQMGKNKHDDVPDGFAQLSIFSETRLNTKATIMKRFF